MSTLDTATIRTVIDELDGWEHFDDRIRCAYTFDDFPAAIAFINRIADLAERANHHPELHNVYADVTVELTSHDAGGVTERDLNLAKQIAAAA